MVNNQIWFVQNPDEPRTTTQLYAQNKQSSSTTFGFDGPKGTNFQGVKWFELMAYVGGMWFVISKLMSMSSKLFNTNYKTLNLEIENLQTQKRSSQSVSPSDLEGGEEEKLSKKQKLAKILNEILTPEQRVKLNSKMQA